MFIDARMRAKFQIQRFQLLLFIARINLESIRQINVGIVSVGITEMRMIIIHVSRQRLHNGGISTWTALL